MHHYLFSLYFYCSPTAIIQARCQIQVEVTNQEPGKSDTTREYVAVVGGTGWKQRDPALEVFTINPKRFIDSNNNNNNNNLNSNSKSNSTKDNSGKDQEAEDDNGFGEFSLFFQIDISSLLIDQSNC